MVTRPLVLLLDDQVSARDSMRDMFDSVGCSVLAVGTEETALQELDARKEIDLVVTDLNLRSGLESDKSGVVFARIVRQLREDVPIAAYSARARELKVSPNDVRAFDLFLDKGEGSSEDVMKFVLECKAYAITHREMAAKLLDKISKRITSTTDYEERIGNFERELKRLEDSVVKKDDLKRVANGFYILFGIVAGIASILGLYLALRGTS